MVEDEVFGSGWMGFELDFFAEAGAFAALVGGEETGVLGLIECVE